MTEYALLVDGEFREIRHYDEKPADIPHKLVTWHDVSREQGAVPFTGLVEDVWVVREFDPALLPPPVPDQITRRQCALELLALGMITGDDAIALARDGTPPAAMMPYFDAMNDTDRTLALIDFAATNYYRNNSLIAGLIAANNMSEADVDAFFISAATR